MQLTIKGRLYALGVLASAVTVMVGAAGLTVTRSHVLLVSLALKL